MIYKGENHPDEYYRKQGLLRDRLFIGYWKGNDSEYLPDPNDYIDAKWNVIEKTIITNYLKSADDFEHYFGMSNCRICDVINGTSEKSDGVYIWPTGFPHYIEEHSVKPPQEFIDHVFERVGKNVQKGSL